MVLRVISAFVSLPIALGFIWLGPPLFSLFAAILAAIGAWELTRMAKNIGKHPPVLVTITWAVALVAIGHVLAEDLSIPDTTRALVAIVAFSYVTWQVRYAQNRIAISDLQITLGISIYIGGMLAFAPLLRGLDQGREWVLLTALATFTTDTLALYVGHTLGRTPLALSISPGKTWEGAIAGLIGAVIVCMVITPILGLPLGFLQQVFLGLLLGVVGQIGDLLESRIKRATDVKDSGTLIPGHGGVLDRLDSIVPNLVLVYYFAIGVVI